MTKRKISAILLVIVLLFTLTAVPVDAANGIDTSSQLISKQTDAKALSVLYLNLSSISNKTVGQTVVVQGSAANPCYRMSAKYTVGGVSYWLGDVYSNSYYKTFTASKAGAYSVTLYARDLNPDIYPKESYATSTSRTFTVTAPAPPPPQPINPTITFNAPSNVNPGTPVTITASATTPCVRMAASYKINGGTEHWLGEILGNRYSKTFTPTTTGNYSVFIHARSYDEPHPNAGKSLVGKSFNVYNRVTPSVTLNPISGAMLNSPVTVSGTSSTPCLRMAASWSLNGGKENWIGESTVPSYNKTFTPTEPGNYTVTLYSRSYVDTDVRSAQGRASRTFTIAAPTPPSPTVSVPLYPQQQNDTCGSASGRMILASYGISVLEKDFVDTVLAINGAGEYKYAPNIASALNQYLTAAGKSVRYKAGDAHSFTSAQYTNLLVKNLSNGHAVQPTLVIRDYNYFPYTTGGHYVVIKGMSYTSGSYKAIINDPHNNYSGVYSVPASSVYGYNTNYDATGFIIYADDL